MKEAFEEVDIEELIDRGRGRIGRLVAEKERVTILCG